jgi:hypothetical protein
MTKVPASAATTVRMRMRPCECATTVTRSFGRKRLPRSETGWAAVSLSAAVRSVAAGATAGSVSASAAVTAAIAFTPAVCLRLPCLAVRRIALVAITVALMAVGCMGGDDGGGYSETDLERMVLLTDDLEGSGWTRFDWGPQTGSDQPTGPRSDPARFGRVDGWKARYRRPGSRQTSGPLVVESRADVFDTPDGARSDFDAYGSELETSGTPLEEVPGLGERAIVGMLMQDDVQFFLVMWRDANAVAAVNVNGFVGKLTREQALELARKQQARMRAVD